MDRSALLNAWLATGVAVLMLLAATSAPAEDSIKTEAKAGTVSRSIGRTSVAVPRREATTTFKGTGGGGIVIIDKDGRTEKIVGTIIRFVPSRALVVPKFELQDDSGNLAERRKALLQELRRDGTQTGSRTASPPRARPRDLPEPPKARGDRSVKQHPRTRTDLNVRRSTNLRSGGSR